MSKEIRIINYVFKVNGKINLISIEQYHNYQQKPAKIKFLYGNDYLEKEISDVNISQNKIIFEDTIITPNMLEVNIGTNHLKIYINNQELINDFHKTNVKNYYRQYDGNVLNGLINEEEVTGKIICDYEVIKTIPDQYYKLYAIDFLDFNGNFNFLLHEEKGINLNLSYKDENYLNKKTLNAKKIKVFKISNIKLKCSGHFLWTINIKQIKSFKAMPSIIPFKYVRCNILLRMKKKLFKTDLKAISKENLLITYQFN